MTTSTFPRLRLGLALLAFLAFGSQAEAQDTGLARGDAVVTGFSGIRPLDTPVPAGANPLDYFVIDQRGPSAEILSLSALGSGPHGQLAPAPVKRQITAAEVGQVFAVTLDDGLGRPVPNIYLGATSAYGIQIVGPDANGDGQPDRLKTGQPGAQFMAGQFGPAPGNPGTIWRVDGTTGAVTAFASLPGNSGPGVGGVVFDRQHQQFFASDLDTGLIYRISADGQVLDSFDHGVNGRPAIGQPPVADDGKTMDISSPSFDSQNPATWGYTQKDRMVWGMAVHDGRLYYAVAGGLQVFSIGIASNGDFAGDPRWELDAKALPGDGPITDMLFDGQGRMLLAQRGAPRGSYDFSVYAEPGKSSVVRYHRETPDDPSTPSVWAPDADEYAIGMRPEFRFADGGIALGYAHDRETGALVPGTCNATLWSTGSRLRSSENPDAVDDGSGPADVHGLQGNDASLVRPQNVPPAQAYYVDYDGLFGDPEKAGHLGDVAIWQPCSGESFEMRGELPPGFFVPGVEVHIPFPPPHGHPTNLRLHKRAIGQCTRWGAGWACRFAITVRNTGPSPYFGPLLISDHPSLPPGSLIGFSPMPPWSCWASGPGFNCVHPTTFLPVGASRHLLVVVWIPESAVRRGQCDLRNVAHIEFAPGGSPWNTNPADDSDGATAHIPARECHKQPPPPPRCPPGYRLVDGQCRNVQRPPEPPQHCPPGTVGDWPNCHRFVPPPPPPPPQSCPPGTVRRGHDCVTIHRECPDGTVRRGDRCVPIVHPCPQGTVRRGDRCVPIIEPCPRGTVRRGHRCEPIVQSCPRGTVRRGHRCEPIVQSCPRGTVRRGHRCEPIVQSCPRGTIRRGHRCVPAVQKQPQHHSCPRGTVGRWPNCRQIDRRQHRPQIERPQMRRPQIQRPQARHPYAVFGRITSTHLR